MSTNYLLVLGTYKFPNLLSQLYYILGQLENSTVKKTRHRYNMVTMILSLKYHLSSSACYIQLRNMDCVSLPQESSLFRLYSNFGLGTQKQPTLISMNVMFALILMRFM